MKQVFGCSDGGQCQWIVAVAAFLIWSSRNLQNRKTKQQQQRQQVITEFPVTPVRTVSIVCGSVETGRCGCEYSMWQCGDWPVRTVSIVCGSVETGRCGLSIESDRTESGGKRGENQDTRRASLSGAFLPTLPELIAPEILQH